MGRSFNAAEMAVLQVTCMRAKALRLKTSWCQRAVIYSSFSFTGLCPPYLSLETTMHRTEIGRALQMGTRTDRELQRLKLAMGASRLGGVAVQRAGPMQV